MSFGFIVLRHVNSEETSKYWKVCCSRIRKYYPEVQILLIDDNSNYDFIEKDEEEKLYKTKIIHSEYVGRGELLPYIYYLKHKLFDVACFIHDSVFINSYINFNVEDYKILWHFDHYYDQEEDEKKMLSLFNNEELLKYHKSKNWYGCFGGMCIIKYNYLESINKKYNFLKLVDYVKNRYNRMSFERVVACILRYNNDKPSIYGDIGEYCMIVNKIIDKNICNKGKVFDNVPLIKIWSGR
jgi:hypothetical protein